MYAPPYYLYNSNQSIFPLDENQLNGPNYFITVMSWIINIIEK